MQEGQNGSLNGKSETLPRTVHKTEAEEVVAVAGSEEEQMLDHESSAADECACSLKSGENRRRAETTGHLAEFYLS